MKAVFNRQNNHLENQTHGHCIVIFLAVSGTIHCEKVLLFNCDTKSSCDCKGVVDKDKQSESIYIRTYGWMVYVFPEVPGLTFRTSFFFQVVTASLGISYWLVA